MNSVQRKNVEFKLWTSYPVPGIPGIPDLYWFKWFQMKVLTHSMIQKKRNKKNESNFVGCHSCRFQIAVGVRRILDRTGWWVSVVSTAGWFKRNWLRYIVMSDILQWFILYYLNECATHPLLGWSFMRIWRKRGGSYPWDKGRSCRFSLHPIQGAISISSQTLADPKNMVFVLMVERGYSSTSSCWHSFKFLDFIQ